MNDETEIAREGFEMATHVQNAERVICRLLELLNGLKQQLLLHDPSVANEVRKKAIAEMEQQQQQSFAMLADLRNHLAAHVHQLEVTVQLSVHDSAPANEGHAAV